MPQIGGTTAGRDKAVVARAFFSDEQYQPWSVIQTWLELRYNLAVVALLQVLGIQHGSSAVTDS